MTNAQLYGSEYDKLINDIKDYAISHIKPSRYEHSLRVAEMCVTLCKKYNLDEKKGYLAGISHDICKSFPEDKMIEYALKDGEGLSKKEKDKYSLLHGRAAAVVLKEKFKIEDTEVLEAVANHTSGKTGMCDITKILFLADKIEPGRPQSTDDYRNNLLKLSLNGILSSVLQENYEFLMNKGIEVCPEEKKMIEYYKLISDNEK